MKDELKSLKRQKLRLKDTIALLAKKEEETNGHRVMRQLGAGGYGKILLAHCVSTRKEVAVKVRWYCDPGQREHD